MSAETNNSPYTVDGYSISTDPALIDIDTAYNFLANDSYWAKGLPRDKFEKAIANSFCFGVYQGDRLAGLARVITDRATFAYLCDVFILPQHRGKGLGKWLIDNIVTHPELQGLRRWSLATQDAHGLYAQFGFGPITFPERWMQIYKPYTEQNGGN